MTSDINPFLPSNEQSIRECAYSLWEADGRPHGRDVEHWQNARRIIASRESQANSSAFKQNGYRALLRFRVACPLNIDDTEVHIKFDGWPAILKSMEGGQALKDASWLVIDLRKIPAKETAESLGNRLKLAITFASLCCRLGVDLGNDMRTFGGFGRVVFDLARYQGVDLQHTVDGLQVVPDRENTRFVRVSGTAPVVRQSEPFLPLVISAATTLPQELPKTRVSLSLLNAALMSQEPLAQMVLATSAVELLGQSEKWSQAQLRLLKRLAVAVTEESSLGEIERSEVANAIRRAYKLSLSEGVRRVLDTLNLAH